MPFQNNTIDISNLQKADLTIGDLRALITVLECATAHLLLPDEATAALDRLRATAAQKGITP
jgi:hypothetical protein